MRAIPATALVFMVGAVGSRVLRRRRSLPLLGKLVLVAGVSVGWWAYRGMLGFAIDVLFLAAVPTIAFAVLSYGDFLLVMRTSIATVRHEDYVMAATAKGLSDRVVRDHHAARNAVLPVLGRLVVSLPYLLSGLIIIEESVGWAGMGTQAKCPQVSAGGLGEPDRRGRARTDPVCSGSPR